MGLRERVHSYTILSDCDGVHVRSVKSFTEAMNLELRKLGFIGDYEPEDNLYFEWAYDEVLRLSDDVATARRIRDFWYNPVVLALAPEDKGTKLAFYLCHLIGFNLEVFTSRPSECDLATILWHSQHLPWLELSEINIRKNHDIDGDAFKDGVIRRLRPDIVFDDDGRVVRRVIRMGINDPSLNTEPRLVSRSWNKGDVDLRDRRGSPGLPIFGAIARNFTFKLWTSL